MTDTARIESQADDGLFAILHAAARAVAGSRNDPVGVLEILPELAGDAEGVAPLAIEAAYAYQGGHRVVYRLDVRTRGVFDDDAALDIARAALTRFGSVKFTNFVVARPATGSGAARRGPYRVSQIGGSGGAELLDVTVYFPSRLPLYARNVALVADPLDDASRAIVERLLGAIGTGHRARGTSLAVPARQLRGAMTLEQQLAALGGAQGEDLVVTLYASALPATRAVRLQTTRAAGRDDTNKSSVDLCISHGLRAITACTSEDTERMQAFVTQHFGARFDSRSWTITNTHGETEDAAERGGAGQQSGIKWPPRHRS